MERQWSCSTFAHTLVSTARHPRSALNSSSAVFFALETPYYWRKLVFNLQSCSALNSSSAVFSASETSYFWSKLGFNSQPCSCTDLRFLQILKNQAKQSQVVYYQQCPRSLSFWQDKTHLDQQCTGLPELLTVTNFQQCAGLSELLNFNKPSLISFVQVHLSC